MSKTTLSDLESINRDWLTAAQVAPVIGADPNWIRWQAHQDKSQLGFPVIVMRSRVKIPKIPFIKFMRGEQDERFIDRQTEGYRAVQDYDD